jgi:hypothetical protein
VSSGPDAVDPRPLVHRAVGLLRRLGLDAGERLLTLLPRTSTGKTQRTGLAEALGLDLR